MLSHKSPSPSLPSSPRLRGLNLFEYVTVTERLSEPLAAYYMEQLVSALEYLHNLDIVHLAIKVLRTLVQQLPLLVHLYNIMTCPSVPS